MKKLIFLFLTRVIAFGIISDTAFAYEADKARSFKDELCTIVYTITNEWTGSQQVSVSITNNSSETLRNWAIKFDCAGEITNVWNAEECKDDGKIIALRNSGYNYEIIPDGTAGFGSAAHLGFSFQESVIELLGGHCDTQTVRQTKSVPKPFVLP